MTAIIEANNVQSINGETINLAIPQNTITVILGASRSGKSALLQQLAGVTVHPKNPTTVCGFETSSLTENTQRELRKRAAYVLPNNALVSNHTIIQNVSLPLIYHTTLARKDAEQEAERLLESVGYQGDYKVLPSALTEQQKRLVNIARNLALKPDVVFIDEAFAYLDNIAKREFVALYQQLQAEGLSLVLATHDSEAAKQCGEQFIFIANEEILFFEDWENLSRSENQEITHYLARTP